MWLTREPSRVQVPFVGSCERLITEPWERKRDQIVDPLAVDRHHRGFDDEPLGSPDHAAAAVSPPVVGWIAWRLIDGVAGGKRAVGRRTPFPGEDHNPAKVDERQRRHAGNDVAHQSGNPGGVVDHLGHRPPFLRCPPYAGASRAGTASAARRFVPNPSSIRRSRPPKTTSTLQRIRTSPNPDEPEDPDELPLDELLG